MTHAIAIAAVAGTLGIVLGVFYFRSVACTTQHYVEGRLGIAIAMNVARVVGASALLAAAIHLSLVAGFAAGLGLLVARAFVVRSSGAA